MSLARAGAENVVAVAGKLREIYAPRISGED